MAGLWYRAGTVSVTNGSKKVTGFGTKWKTSVSKPDKGHTVWAPDGKAYELDYVESDTVLWLVSSYSGTTAADQHYAIDISRSGSNSAFSRDLSAFVAYNQLQMDGWQQLLTGTGDVTLTAPDGTKLTVPSWEKIMNAGTGVVAQAKTEADRAKSEASKAAAHATAAGDVVAASALPLPDVWAPLCDSLRMITGYGRDIMVGSDVIARMLGFSRSTAKTYTGRDGRVKIAAVNEPAFEAPGLLLEGASTNLIPSFPVSGSSVTIQKTTHPAFDIPVYRLTVAPGTTGYVVVPTQKLVSKYTASVWATVESGIPSDFYLQTNYKGSDGVLKAATVSLAQSSFTRRSVTCINKVEGAQDNYINIVNNGPAPCVVLVAGWQLEELPWASSYIPTDGAAATRAADILPLTAVRNFAPEGTYALEVVNARPAPGSGGRIFWGVSAINDVFYGARLAPDGELAFLSGSAADKTVIATGIEAFTGVMAFSMGRTSRFGPYTKQLPTSLPSSPMVSISIGSNAAGNDNIFCHVRNLRGWLKPLANEQIKAIK